MQITGTLRSDILEGKAVLFLGAGVGSAVGLHSTKDLANLIFQRANSPQDLEEFKDDLSELVARLDYAPRFGRKFTDEVLIDYFNEPRHYTNLSLIKRLLNLPWQCIITTNYDRSLELAFDNPESDQKYPRRLLTIRNPNDPALITDRDSNKLRYFKIHGCAYDLRENPKNALNLVLTDRDFRERSRINSNIWKEMEALAYHCSIIYIGFKAHMHSEVLNSVFNAKSELNRYANFPSYAVLKDVDANTKFKLENQFDIILLDGEFEDFLDTVDKLFQQENIIESQNIPFIDNETYCSIKNGNHKSILVPKASVEYNQSQFYTFYEGYFEDQAKYFNSLTIKKRIDLWQNNPTLEFMFSQRPIKRTQFSEALNLINSLIEEHRSSSSLPSFIIKGERGCGKTVFVNQIARELYERKGYPVLLLNPKACYVENENGRDIVMQGWELRKIDEFISNFELSVNEEKIVPIIVADNMIHRIHLVQHLEKHLINHKKKCLIIYTAGSDEMAELKSLSTKVFDLEHKLDDTEISALCDSVLQERLDQIEKKPEMIRRAVDINDGKRDILFILFMWFDERFRRLNDIIAEEALKISERPQIKKLYVAIALFRQYHLEANFPISFKSLNISVEEFKKIEQDHIFRALISIRNTGNSFYAETRHPQFNRMMVSEIMGDDYDGRVDILCEVINAAGTTDVDFLRAFFVYIIQYESTTYSLNHLRKMKKAFEQNPSFINDYVTHHQFANRLIKETENDSLIEAEEYLERALEISNDMPSVIHTRGNLKFTQFKRSFDIGFPDIKYFESARDYFQRVRARSFTPEEHDYVTEIDMITYRLENFQDDSSQQRAYLAAELNGLILEAMKVIPSNKQYLLKRRIEQYKKEFRNLSEEEQSDLLEIIHNGNASHLLLEYYINDLIGEKNRNKDRKGIAERVAERNWHKIRDIINKYFKEGSPISVLITMGSLSKRAFTKGSKERFDLLSKYYDDYIRYKNINISTLLLGEYIQLLYIDAFALNNFTFLKQAVQDFLDVYEYSFPRFLRDEYILENRYYNLSATTTEDRILMFLHHSEDFYLSYRGKRFQKDIFLNSSGDPRFYNVEINPENRFYIRGIKKEIDISRNKIRIDFCIKFAFDGFKVSDPKTIGN